MVKSNGSKANGTIGSQGSGHEERPYLCSQAALVQIPAPPLPACIALGMFLNLSKAISSSVKLGR